MYGAHTRGAASCPLETRKYPLRLAVLAPADGPRLQDASCHLHFLRESSIPARRPGCKPPTPRACNHICGLRNAYSAMRRTPTSSSLLLFGVCWLLHTVADSSGPAKLQVQCSPTLCLSASACTGTIARTVTSTFVLNLWLCKTRLFSMFAISAF